MTTEKSPKVVDVRWTAPTMTEPGHWRVEVKGPPGTAFYRVVSRDATDADGFLLDRPEFVVYSETDEPSNGMKSSKPVSVNGNLLSAFNACESAYISDYWGLPAPFFRCWHFGIADETTINRHDGLDCPKCYQAKATSR